MRIIVLRAGVEFRPDFAVVGVEGFQGPTNPRLVEQRGVGDEHELHVVQFSAATDLGAHLDGPIEVGASGRLAVAAEGDVVEPAKRGGRVAKLRPPVDVARDDQLDHPIQFVGKRRRDRQACRRPGRRAVDLAIDAAEVAELVGIEVHADRDSARAAAEHRIDVAVGRELARMGGEDRTAGK